ncbi:uncharacterized protein LOC109507914 [Hippocampus comes]|uniref:uncharacterized protein LOC109507914 n=1 Tax=Hippocampus comes TaxID=109280 RepID=UPI00094E649F|nr:PREDICTED: uncharacterized protein LOC109507914 [Hippocampus comes]
MSRRGAADAPAAALTPQLPPRAHRHRPLCVSVSSDSSGRFKALDTQEWKNNLKAQMEQAHSAGAASSTGSLERASLFCAPGGPSKATARFSLFSPPWNVSSESDSNPPSRSGSKKLRNYSRRAATGPAGAHEQPGGEAGVDIADVKQRCFEDINECIHASAGKRKRVLVHCGDGFSLAPTCVIQYLMLKRNMRLVAAYELLRARYPVNIRECHRNLLVSLERTLRPGDADPESFKQAISRKVAWT